jgi:subtilisin family serine protease
VRVFGRNTDALLTSILDGVEFAVSVNASIINLSLGGGPYSYAADKYFQKMVEAGVTLVAAAGNEGSGDTPSYPASYESVISVAAVDQAMERADFSNFNDMIDLSAPGAGVLSTVPMGNGSIAVFSNGEDIRIGSFLEYSVPLASNQTTTGSIVHCPNLGFDICPGPGGHFCLIKRGTTSFASKAKNCELSGGIAALIYNDGVGYLMGTLENSTINIPVIGLSEEDGLALLFNNANEHNGNSTDVVISSVDGYGFSDGTSMAAPYLTGSVALLKQSCAACSNNDIVRCLKATASDLGEDGWDTIYGHGLIQLEDAFNCLVDTLECCYESQVSEQQPTNVGSGAAPTIMPSQSNETTSSLYPVPSKTRYTAMPSLLPLPTYQIIGLLHTDVPTKLGASVAIDANEMLPPSSIGYWLPEEDTSSASASIKFLVVSISMLYVLLEFA